MIADPYKAGAYEIAAAQEDGSEGRCPAVAVRVSHTAGHDPSAGPTETGIETNLRSDDHARFNRRHSPIWRRGWIEVFGDG
jgi:hypothetical protein